MKYKNYIISTYQGHEDPREYKPVNRFCNVCGIKEENTYFIEEQNICEDCNEEEKEEILERAFSDKYKNK